MVHTKQTYFSLPLRHPMVTTDLSWGPSAKARVHAHLRAPGPGAKGNMEGKEGLRHKKASISQGSGREMAACDIMCFQSFWKREVDRCVRDPARMGVRRRATGSNQENTVVNRANRVAGAALEGG